MPMDKLKFSFITVVKYLLKILKLQLQEIHLNVGVTASMLGLKASIYTETGKDENTLRLINELNNLDISTEFVIQNEGTPDRCTHNNCI
jgi:hypothetical protein